MKTHPSTRKTGTDWCEIYDRYRAQLGGVSFEEFAEQPMRSLRSVGRSVASQSEEWQVEPEPNTSIPNGSRNQEE